MYDLEPFMIVMFSVIFTSSTTFFILSYGEDVLVPPSGTAARLLEDASGAGLSLGTYLNYFTLDYNKDGFDVLNHFYKIY